MMKTRLTTQKAQSILEYVLLMAVVVLVIIYGANEVLKPKAKANMESAGKALDTAKTEFDSRY